MSQRGGRPIRVSEAIALRIQRQISVGRLVVGAKLPAEREMARRYKASRVSVREAYRSLEELGVLTIRRGTDGGAFITGVDHVPVQRSLSAVLRLGRLSHRELTEARLMIEPSVARLAARRATPQDIDRLNEVIERQEKKLARKGSYRPTNMQFHRTMAECAHNLPLATLMNSLVDLMLELVEKIDVPRKVQQRNCLFHRRIVDAIERHDEDTAHQLMLQHIGQIQSGIGESLAKHLRPGGSGTDQGAKRKSRRRTRPS